MTNKPEGAGSRACWFVGAAYGSDDQTGRFLTDGIWENGYQDKYLDQVKSIQTGDRIAIKSTYIRKRDLSFDNRGHSVSVMAIKAIGIIKKNHGDGRTLDVEWAPFDPPREWYFYTNRSAVWRVLPGDWTTDALISFAFEDKPQDLSQFRNAPYWRERFGDTSVDKSRFLWTRFYEAIADKLLLYRDKRDELIEGIHAIGSKVKGLSNLQDQFQDGSTSPLEDICPFTAMGIFNRGITDVNRKNIAAELAAFLGLEEAVPDSFEGIPIINNQKSWFFGFGSERNSDDIDSLWEIFAQAITFSDSDDADVRSGFISAYDSAAKRFGVGWNLTAGLYWIRPWNFPTLDGRSQIYISKNLNIKIGRNGPNGRCNANDYLAVLDTLETRFQEEAYPVHSFPELSLTAYEESASLSELDKDIGKFKLVCKDFVSFTNPGKVYMNRERSYKDKVIKQAAVLFTTLNEDGGNAAEIYLKMIEMAKYFSRNDKYTIKNISSNTYFQLGLAKWFKAIVTDSIDKEIFDEVSTLMQKAKIASYMFLQTILFPPLFFNPKKYFALKSSYLRKVSDRYGFSIFKKGEFLSYEQFLATQRFANFLHEALGKFEPKDMLDIQSFLWTADSFDGDGLDPVMIDEDAPQDKPPLTGERAPSIKPYMIDDIMKDGCFIEQVKLEEILKRLREKKNLILQGPPGTGKTWLARKLAFALIGQKNHSKVRAVQFHPNLSYEDFVRGWRPSGDGKLTLVDGPFLEMIRAAENEPSTKHVIVIEEINRGNPAQIFGEMLTLLEADKRTPSEALELSYRRRDDERVFIPANLYVIGTMNIADRSLALVDLALRRRFAFIDLKPALGEAWRNWVETQWKIAPEILDEIKNRILSLNTDISSDPSLGEQFSIGHSHVTPSSDISINDAGEWFRQVVDTEIGPLLDEYWFDSLDKAQKARERLLKGFQA